LPQIGNKFMAVPKKRVSRMRKNLRHTQWKKEIISQALQALSLGKAATKGRLTSSFQNPVDEQKGGETNSNKTEP
jgi:large subunit ribosomal protein L32